MKLNRQTFGRGAAVFLVVCALSGCGAPARVTSSAEGETYYQKAVSASQQGDSLAAKAALDSSCQWKHAAACALLGRPASFKIGGLAVLQGATDESSTQIVVQHPASGEVRVELWESETLRLLPVRDSQKRTYQGSDKQLTWYRFRGLTKGKHYRLLVFDAGRSLLDIRSLSALDIQKPELTFAVASCLDDSYHSEQGPMWQQVLSHRPDFLLLIGDNVYADKIGAVSFAQADPAQLWRRYAETRERLALFRAERLVPVIATWDDHDYGVNDGDGTYPHKQVSTDIFFRFFAQEVVAGFLERGPGVSSYFVASGQRFLLMDDRSFRSPAKSAFGETHWGEEQEAWAFKALAKPMPTFLINGDQFFGAYHKFESYEGRHPKSFRKILGQLRVAKSPVFFISGDRHLAELMEIPARDTGYATYELTTSAIHAKTFPQAWKESPNPRQIAGVSGELNYALLKTKATGLAVEVDLTVLGRDRKIHFARKLRVQR